MYHAAHFQSTEKFQSFTSFLIEKKGVCTNFLALSNLPVNSQSRTTYLYVVILQ